MPESGVLGQYRYNWESQKPQIPFTGESLPQVLVLDLLCLGLTFLHPTCILVHICTVFQTDGISLLLKWCTIFSLLYDKRLFYCSLIPFAVLIMAAPKRQSPYPVTALVQPLFCLPVRQGTPIHLQKCTDVVY